MMCVCSPDESYSELLTSSFTAVIIVQHCPSILLCDLHDQCVILNRDANFIQHLHLCQEQLMVPFQCHVSSLVKLVGVEFFLYVHNSITEFPVFLKGMYERSDDHQQCNAILVCCLIVMMRFQTFLESISSLSQDETVKSCSEVSEHFQFLPIHFNIHLP